MTEPATAVCRHCAKRFNRQRHTNRYQRAGGNLIASMAYCSPACRQAAYRVRKDIKAGIPASARRYKIRKRRRRPLSASVTEAIKRSPKFRREFKGLQGAKKRPYPCRGCSKSRCSPRIPGSTGLARAASQSRWRNCAGLPCFGADGETMENLMRTETAVCVETASGFTPLAPRPAGEP